MEENKQLNIRDIVRGAIQEFVNLEQAKAEPAYKAELVEERRRREQLEQRLNELAEENKRSRMRAEDAERSSAIRGELQRLGVSKIDLAFKAVREDIARAEDGRLYARTDDGEVGLKDYLSKFVTENPELLPARIPGGSGAGAPHKPAMSGGVDLDKIKPGMSAEDMDRVRQEISRIASQSIRGI